MRVLYSTPIPAHDLPCGYHAERGPREIGRGAELQAHYKSCSHRFCQWRLRVTRFVVARVTLRKQKDNSVELSVGRTYVVKHSSGFINARFSGVSENSFGRRASKRYHFVNLSSGREIVLKSKVKIWREVK